MGETVATGHIVGSILTKEVLTVDSDEPLRTAAWKMFRENVGSVVVTRFGVPVGIITERDIVQRCREIENLSSFEAMSVPLITVEPETSILEGLEIMLGNHIRRLIVTKDNELRGVVSIRDIVVWVLRETYKPNIPEYLKPLIRKIERLERL
jgi:CBS domain-containing protein